MNATESMTDKPVYVEFATTTETIRICGGLEDFAGLEHPAMLNACEAYNKAAVAALDGDPRAARLTISGPRERRLLHSQWAGTKFSYSAGSIGTMGDLTEDEKAAVSAADDAGRAAAKAVIERYDAT